MIRTRRLILSCAGSLLLFLSVVNSQEQNHDQHSSIESLGDSMTPGHHQAHNAHLYLTPLRQRTQADEKRAHQLLEEIRSSIQQFQDYKVAEEAGYKIFFGHIPLAEYHFTNRQYARKALMEFDPGKPTSLLYKKNSSGYTLTGVMFTAHRFATEEDLNERVPLSIARWHKHINICLPPKSSSSAGSQRGADQKFGPRGSITTEAACKAEGGRWFPQLFGWMVHVYPFESDPQKIWAH